MDGQGNAPPCPYSSIDQYSLDYFHPSPIAMDYYIFFLISQSIFIADDMFEIISLPDRISR
jgi:hypothetical protein